MKIRTHADIVELEKTPLTERIRQKNVYELVRDSGAAYADRVAFRSLSGTTPNDPARDVTYTETLKRVIQAANLFHAEGIGPNDTVTILMPGVPETFFALWGAEIAAVANPVNYFLNASQITGIMKEAGTKALVAADPALFPDIWPKVEEIRAAMPGLKVFRSCGKGPAPAGTIDFETALDRQPGDRLIAPKPLERDTVAALFHTGGTTGLPKLARHTHGALTLAAWTNVLMFDLGPGTVMINPLPQFHVGGSIIGGLSPIANGWTVLLPTPLGARNPNVVRDFWSIVERNKVTVGGAVPTSLAAIMNVPREGDLSSLKVFVSGGSTVPVELIRRIEGELGVPVVEGYGMTEVHCYSTMNPMHGERRPGSVGLRLPYTEVRVADVAGDTIRGDCALGTIGHVLMRGPQVTPGYLDPRHNRGAMLADGWLDSGDLGRLDKDGYLWLTGRSKDLIIRGGHNIDPIVIEEALVRHPAVETAAAVGLPDTYAGELPLAFVQLRPGAKATPDELREFARKEIPERAAVPVQVMVIAQMPLTGVGKIFKPALRLDAARCAFETALAPIKAEGKSVDVIVRNDATHGTLAVVRVDGGASETMVKRCAELLGGFQIRHVVE